MASKKLLKKWNDLRLKLESAAERYFEEQGLPTNYSVTILGLEQSTGQLLVKRAFGGIGMETQIHGIPTKDLKI